MVSIREDGRVAFSMLARGAERVEIVGVFDGWHTERRPMVRGENGQWTVQLDIGAGVHWFRYLIDGDAWALDETAHGECTTDDGQVWSRLYQPPDIDPDAIAA